MTSRAQRRSPVAFACGFARRNCPHDTMFHDAYQRTNRTRGTKILRCFPHCCPRHVDRSYCGGPVYLQVDLTIGDIGDRSLCVFAHFHPKAMPGLALGQFVARSMFHENQQTDTNATGEWIGARLMASADRTTWMFEVNPSGRWYYQWESGATKAQRATEHVFEAYVFVVNDALDRCEVVAKAVSRDFRMISFRRAPTDAKTHSPEVGDRKATADDNAGATAIRWRASEESVVSSDADIASHLETLTHQSAPLSPPPTLERPLSPLSPTGDASPLSLLPPPAIVRISHHLGSLVDFLQTLPATALDVVVPEIRRVVLTPFAAANASNAPLGAFLGPPVPSPRASFPVPLVTAVLRIALWLLFDRQLLLSHETDVEQASAGLLDKAALYASYFASLERLDRRVDTFLATTRAPNSTLATLASDVERHLQTAPSSSQVCRGLESFVAQAREVFLAGSDLGPRRRRRPATAVDPTLMRDLDSFAAVWIMDLNSLQWFAGGRSHTLTPSAFVMLWAWRQAVGLDIAVEDDAVPATLAVTSLWNPSRRRDTAVARGSRFVLDGKPRWLRVYPSGESTSSVVLGVQRLGHYVASFRRDTREVLVNLYLWPSALSSSSSGDASCCFCLRWCVRLETDDGGLDVRVAIERGRLSRGVDAAALDEQPLTHKLERVEQWTTTSSLHFVYRRR